MVTRVHHSTAPTENKKRIRLGEGIHLDFFLAADASPAAAAARSSSACIRSAASG